MPTGKLTKQHKTATKANEAKWKKAKKAAMKTEGTHDYFEGVFKKMMVEGGAAPSFLQFLLIENDIDTLNFGAPTTSAYSAADTGELDGLDPKDDPNGVYSNDEEFPPAEDIEVDLDTDERFLALPRPERFRIKKLAQELSGYELDDELTQAYEKSVGGSSFFTNDTGHYDDPSEMHDEQPVVARDPNAPRHRAKSGATHAYKIRRGI
jgi:hypothetical protein